MTVRLSSLSKAIKANRGLLFTQKPIARHASYYVVVPEIPSDTPETNPLIRDTPLPAFKQIKPEHVLSGLLKRSIDFDVEFYQTMENTKIKQKLETDTFDNIFLPLEKSLVDLEYAQKTAQHLAYIFPFTKFITNYYFTLNNVDQRRNQRWVNAKLYEILQDFQSNSHILNDTQRRLLYFYTEKCKLNGLHFPSDEADKFSALQMRLGNQYTEFKNRLRFTTNKFNIILNNKSQVADIPFATLKRIATDQKNPTKGPWCLTLNEKVYRDFMKFSSQRQLRRSLYETYYTRASDLSESQFLNNSENIKKTLLYRKQKAQLFGFKNYMQFTLDTKAAQNLENVVEVIETIRVKVKPEMAKDYDELRRYSMLDTVEPWDVEYLKHKHANELYNVDEAKVMQYFPLNNVLNGIVGLFRLFGVDLVRNRNIKEDNVWHEDVLVFDVVNREGKPISTLMIDPYARKNKMDGIWSFSGMDCSAKLNKRPIAYLMLNVRKIVSHNPEQNLVKFEQIEQLFYNLGKVFQILLANTEYSELSNLSNIEYDAYTVISRLFQRFAYVPEIIGLINNDSTLKSQYLSKLTSRSQHMRSFGIMNEAYVSAFDIECHINDEKYWLDILEELWPKYMLTNKVTKDFNFPCQMVDEFGADLGGLHYSQLWSNMLSADLFDAFNETGFENTEQIANVFDKFRKIFLQDANLYSTNEKFRRFRGRNPSVNPFIKELCDNNRV